MHSRYDLDTWMPVAYTAHATRGGSKYSLTFTRYDDGSICDVFGCFIQNASLRGTAAMSVDIPTSSVYLTECVRGVFKYNSAPGKADKFLLDIIKAMQVYKSLNMRMDICEYLSATGLASFTHH